MKVRIALLNSLACLSSLVFVPPVRAQGGPPAGGGSSGQWVITYDYAATGTETDSTSVPKPIDHKETGDTGSVGFNSYWGHSNTQTATINYTNTITAHLNWMQSDGVDAQGNPKWKSAANPPKKVFIEKHSVVGWNKGSVGTFAGSTATGSCSDGLGDTDNEDAGSGSAGGTHIVQKDGSSGSIDITCQQSANCTVTDGTPTSPYSGYPGYQPHYHSEAFMSWSFSVWLTDRGISISREGAHDEKVDDDGNTHGDTIRSYMDISYPQGADPITNIPAKNWQQFDAALIGSWHTKTQYIGGLFPTQVPDVTFTWQPQYSGATVFWNQWLQDFGKQNFVSRGSAGAAWEGSTGPGTPDTMTYTVTDNQDGITATAVYSLTRHDPIEFLHADPDVKHIEDVHRVSDWGRNNDPQNPHQITCYVEQASTWGASIGFGADVAVSKWQGVNLGLNLDFSYTYTINTGVSATATDVPFGYGTYMEGFTVYQYHTGTVSKWDAGGPSGFGSYFLKVPDGSGHQLHYPYELLSSGSPPSP